MSYHKKVFWIDPISEIDAKNIPNDFYTTLWLTVLAFFFCLDSLHFIDNIGQKVKEFLSLLQFFQFPQCILLNAFESLKFDLLTIIFVVFQQNAFSVPRRFYLRDFQTIHLYNFSSLYDIINWLEAMNIFRAHLLINE